MKHFSALRLPGQTYGDGSALPRRAAHRQTVAGPEAELKQPVDAPQPHMAEGLLLRVILPAAGQQPLDLLLLRSGPCPMSTHRLPTPPLGSMPWKMAFSARG